VIEKPFGSDLKSAAGEGSTSILQRVVFHEDSVYRDRSLLR